jgi:RNA polymerase sigma-70 factor (ECF subfamily)
MRVHAEQLVEAAFTQHRAAVVRHLTMVTRDPDAAEDLAQEAFLRLAREVEADRTPDDPGAWLHRVGTNLAMSRGRHLQVVDRREAELPRPANLESPEHAVVEHELAKVLVAFLAQMSGAEQRALTLAAHGYDGLEIAANIGRTPGATRTLLCRARAKMRMRMQLAGFAGV